jgi:Methyltransferase domain
MTPNRQFNVASPNSLPVRVATWQRRRMFERFKKELRVAKEDSVLDLGVTSDRSYSSSNYLEAWYPWKDRITAAGLDDASFLEQQFPGVRFVYANGLRLPFADRAFDIVHSSAVLEHVGAAENQAVFVRECMRVARKAVFLTTPNRWFPIEFHTLLPFAHWLPQRWFRWLLPRIGLEFFADERHLNLLSRRQMIGLVASTDDYRVTVSSVELLGWPSNLLLIAWRKTEAGQ